MSTRVDSKDAPKVEDPKPGQSTTDKRLNGIADDSAKKAAKTEQRYDRDHGIFTK